MLNRTEQGTPLRTAEAEKGSSLLLARVEKFWIPD
jgi:hypothetical protein